MPTGRDLRRISRDVIMVESPSVCVSSSPMVLHLEERGCRGARRFPVDRPSNSKTASLVAANLLRGPKDAVHFAAKMLHLDQGHASVLSEPAGSETKPPNPPKLPFGSGAR